MSLFRYSTENQTESPGSLVLSALDGMLLHNAIDFAN